MTRRPTLSRALAAGARAILLLAVACASDPGLWVAYQQAGDAALRDGRYPRAGKLLGLAEQEAGALGPAAQGETALSKARLARKLARLEEARTSLSAAEGLLDAAPDAPAVLYARSLRERGELALATGELGEAETSFRLARDEAARASGWHDAEVGFAWLGLGWTLRAMGRPYQARRAVDHALVLHRGVRTVDELRPATPIGLVEGTTLLAALHRDAGRLDAAREELHGVIRIATEVGSAEHPEVARLLVELARIELRAGDPIAADRAAERAAEIARIRLPAGHPLRVDAEALASRPTAPPRQGGR